MKKFRFGKAFIDELSKVATKTKHHTHRKDSSSWSDYLIGSVEESDTSLLSPWRRMFFMVIFLIAVSFLFIRLFHLQIAQGEYHRELADSNRIQVRIIHAPRGVIYDRNGEILARNDPGFRLIEKGKEGTNKYAYISRDEALKLEISENSEQKSLEIDNLRTYPRGERTAHLLGYLSEITPAELKNSRFAGYKAGDRIGRGGVEEVYEKVLKGIDGGEVIEVDAQGKKIRTLRKNEAVPGQNLYLAIDASLQEVAYKALEKTLKEAKSRSCCAAAIASNPLNGQLLALVSLPSYNPNEISNSLNNPNSPFLNRAISGVYPPGSTYKIASSLAGLESGKVTADTKFEDTGVMYLGPYKFANWFFTQHGRKEEGLVDVVKALKRSNDIFFYRLGQTVGETQMAETSKKLGLGKILGIDLPGEASGVIPDGKWKEENIGEIWFPGDSLHMAIGQGFILSTPLQIQNLVSLIAADGKQYPPHLALKITTPDNKIIKEYEYENTMKYSFKKEHIDLIKQGLEEVPAAGGTAWPFFTFPIKTAGKTGTAEFGDPKDNTHAWYTGYAPAESPEIAATVLIEAGGEGSSIASPVVKEIFRYYFSPDKRALIKDIGAPVSTQSAQSLGE